MTGDAEDLEYQTDKLPYLLKINEKDSELDYVVYQDNPKSEESPREGTLDIGWALDLHDNVGNAVDYNARIHTLRDGTGQVYINNKRIILDGEPPSTDTMLKSVYDMDNDGIVDDSNKLNGEAGLYYLDFNNFVNIPNIPNDLSDLVDVDTVTNTPATGQVLKWDGSTWVPGNEPSFTPKQEEITATAGQNTITTEYNPNFIIVSKNGYILSSGEYNAADGSTITFTNNLSENDIINIYTII